MERIAFSFGRGGLVYFSLVSGGITVLLSNTWLVVILDKWSEERLHMIGAK